MFKVKGRSNEGKKGNDEEDGKGKKEIKRSINK